jgi:uncharacterized repeat protein (TIGR03803 family)
MARIVDALLSKRNWGKRAYAAFALCATTAIALPAQTFTPLFSFDGMDGGNPLDYVGANGLVQGTDGRLYGTTDGGGKYGYGTVFKINVGSKLTTLYNFPTCGPTNCPSGESPGGLIQATDGDFYGITQGSGGDAVSCNNQTVLNGCGTVFKITPGGKLTTLYSFCAQANCADGFYPNGLTQATNRDFYGTTNQGGANNGAGTVFKITPAGTLTTLYSFCSQTNCTDGMWPLAGLMQDTNGNLYGTTIAGGAGNGGAFSNDGTVFSVNVGLGPFVETQTTSGKVGAVAKILGTDLTDATGVGFHGTAAVFTVVSASEITTTVPDGATTGTVQVVTPSGTLSSYVPFRVHK